MKICMINQLEILFKKKYELYFDYVSQFLVHLSGHINWGFRKKS